MDDRCCKMCGHFVMKADHVRRQAAAYCDAAVIKQPDQYVADDGNTYFNVTKTQRYCLHCPDRFVKK